MEIEICAPSLMGARGPRVTWEGGEGRGDEHALCWISSQNGDKCQLMQLIHNPRQRTRAGVELWCLRSPNHTGGVLGGRITQLAGPSLPLPSSSE
jgi:hypothetical protein